MGMAGGSWVALSVAACLATPEGLVPLLLLVDDALVAAVPCTAPCALGHLGELGRPARAAFAHGLLLCLPRLLLLLPLYLLSKALHRCFIAGLLSCPLLVCGNWFEVAEH